MDFEGSEKFPLERVLPCPKLGRVLSAPLRYLSVALVRQEEGASPVEAPAAFVYDA